MSDENHTGLAHDHFGQIECPACERAKTLTLARILPSLLFSEASILWLNSRRASGALASSHARFLRESTEDSYAHYIDSLNLFFANLPLEKIHIGHIRQYQEARVAGAPPFIRKRRPNKNVQPGPCPVQPKKVNQELSILQAIMRRAGCWTQELDEFYEPFLEEISDIPRALSPNEQRLWLEVACSRREWWIVYWYSELAFATTMGTNEMRAERIGDINLNHEIVNVSSLGAKNKYRVRTIPLVTAESKWAAEQLLLRAKDLGASSPVHYLFPFRKGNQPHDPARPMTVSGIKKPWNEVRMASGLRWFRPYDTRHTAITRWAEAGMGISEIMAMAGHMSRRMMLHYTHISQQAKRRALEAMAAKKPPLSERAEIATPFYISNRVP